MRLDVENAGARLLVTLLFYVVHEVVYFMVARGMVTLNLQWSWPHELGAALPTLWSVYACSLPWTASSRGPERLFASLSSQLRTGASQGRCDMQGLKYCRRALRARNLQLKLS